MTSFPALSLINRWLHSPNPDLDSEQKLPDSPQPVAAHSIDQQEQGCTGYQTGTGAILHQHQKQLDQLYGQLNLPNELLPLFDQTLDRLVNWLHLLPAHPQHHCEPAGAVRHALEIAFWSVAATEQIHFDHRLYPDQRRARQPLWRLMAGVSGLLYDCGRIVSSIEVAHEEAGIWPSVQTGLGSWLQQHRITHYCPHWLNSDNCPEKPLLSEYTCANLLLLDKLTSHELVYALKPNHDKSALWQTFISCLTGQISPQGIPQMVNAIELARLKSVKLHFIRGVALAALSPSENPPEQPVSKLPVEENSHTEESDEEITPSTQNSEPALNYLQQVVSHLAPENTRWKKESLVLRWPEDCQLPGQENFPTATELLEQWSQKGWLRQIGEEKTFLRGGQRYVFLQPGISQACQQWLATTKPEQHSESSPC